MKKNKHMAKAMCLFLELGDAHMTTKYVCYSLDYNLKNIPREMAINKEYRKQ